RRPEAWNLKASRRAVVVVVIDTGLDHTHPDLAGNVWTNPREIPEDGIDNDRNGYTDDVHGYDVVEATATRRPQRPRHPRRGDPPAQPAATGSASPA
ncbi:MAG: hypothetical protein IPL43_04280, partial [Micropruina sp.]|nr:hypothetical protein [Micropruina sp.]